MTAKVYELGMNERTVVVEFESLARALAAYESPAYQEALRALGKDASSATCEWGKAPTKCRVRALGSARRSLRNRGAPYGGTV
jgi:hypothetical protein